MPKKNYNNNVSRSENAERIPLFKRPYDGGRITALEGDVNDIFDRIEGLEGRFDGLDDRLEILRACQGKGDGTHKGAGAATPPPPPPPAPSGVKQQVAAGVKDAMQSQPKPQPQSQPTTESKPAPAKDGWPKVGYAYVWWDSQNRVWVPCTDIWAAKQAGNGVYHPKWAWLDAQHRLVRFLTQEEIVRYCP